MVNRITRKIPVSSYKVKYTIDGKERDVSFVTLSGLDASEIIRIVRQHMSPYKSIFVSPDVEETPIGTRLYETTIVKYLEIATAVKDMEE